MPASDLLLLPPALLAASALLTWLPLNRAQLATRLPAAGVWAATAALVAFWIPTRTAREASLATLGAGATLGLRLDSVTFTFALAVLVPLGLLLTLRSNRRGDAAYAALGASGTILGMEASTLLVSTFCWTATCTLLLLSPRHESAPISVRFWAQMMIAAALLLLGSCLLIVSGGTSDYSAVPVSALSVPAFATIAAGALWFSAALPWRTWFHLVWHEAGAVSASLFATVLVPIGMYLLTRAYDLGNGRWPRALLNVAVIAIAVLAQLVAVYRAQRAATLTDFLVEALPFTTGAAVTALAVGTPAGAIASVGLLAGLALLLPMLPLMSYSASPLVLLGLVVVAGLPPTLAFGSRLLALQADVEAGALGAFAAIAGACAYVLLLAAGARAARLPSVTTRESRHAIWPVVILAAGSVVAGAFVGPVLQTFALPVATQVMNVTGQPVSAGFFSVVTDSGTWAAFALAVPALAVVVFLAAARARHVYGVQRHREPPPPFLDLPTFPLVERVRQFRLQPASNPGQELRLPEALTAMPLGVLALLFGLLVFVVTRWSA